MVKKAQQWTTWPANCVSMHGRCVLDGDMALGNMSLPFHSIGFNMIGFAKIKYILNTLALGRDVVFMDTDIVVGTDCWCWGAAAVGEQSMS